ncbi:tetratricopeptide repeat protein [uncultured Brachyspira sp.]|uniref:tetratricopeptide repeat protein n=1 Tax=uncultured Brachyspira sp. TaxID=221953 RepID=UPI002608DA4A|nr:tetratricopeptide repeat protein [uncultured Brachyspira sp.]
MSKMQKNAELILAYIYNNRLIFISAFVLIIVIIAGILVYRMNIESQDEKINIDFESALALYNVYQNSQLPDDQLNNPGLIIDITSRFQKVYSAAKGKNLKLRSAYALGSVYYDVENFKEAEKYYQEVANARGFYLQESAIYNLANTQIDLSNYTQAANTLENFMKAYPKSYLIPQAALTLSDVYLAQNDKTKSINILKTWMSQNTNNTEYLNKFKETITLIENNIY